MQKENLLQVVSELVGYINPCGDLVIDETRYINQEKVISLVQNGIDDLIKNSKCEELSYKNESIRRICSRAYETLNNIYQKIGDNL